MKLALRGVLAGLVYSLAVTIVSIWNMQLNLMFRADMPPFTEGLLKATILTLAMGLPLGLITAPLLKLPWGRLLQLLGMTLIWGVLEYVFAIDSPMIKGGAIAGAGIAFILVLASWGAMRVRRLRYAPAALAALLLIAAFVIPEARFRLTKPAARAAETIAPAPEGAPDVVLIVLDTVRAQNVSAYGYERETTPTFDVLSAEGALFLDATSPSTWSLPSHASLFTGLFPSVHGCHGEHRYLNAEIPSLPEIMSQHGYETFCFTANPHISENFGLTRGFQYSDESWKDAQGGRSFLFIFRLLDRLGFGLNDKGGGRVAGNVERFMMNRPADAPPTFVFINFLEAHFPYHQTPDEFLAQFTDLSRSELQSKSLELFSAQFGGSLPEVAEAAGPAMAMYDSGVAYSDHLLKRVVDALRKRGTLDDTVLVVLSDHGELLGEHGDFGHGISLYEEMTRVPFMMRFPREIPAGTRVETPVSTVGAMATVLELTGLEPPERVHVGSLLPAFEGQPAGLPVMAEQFARPDEPPKENPLLSHHVRHRSYRVGQDKIISLSSGETYLFDLESDPGEEKNLASEDRETRERLKGELADWSALLGLPELDAEIQAGEVPEMDPEARERLKALGYLQ